MASTRDIVQLSFGRKRDWELINPVLLEGELVCIYDDDGTTPIDLKFGNGVSRYTELPSLININDVYNKSEIDNLLDAIRTLATDTQSANEELSEKVDKLSSVIVSFTEEGKLQPGTLVDKDLSESNKLTALSTVLTKIEEALVARFGRLIYATEDKNSFASVQLLISGPWYYKGQSTTPQQGDLASITGKKYPYVYNGASWEQDGGYTDEQLAALNSGITTELVEQIQTLKQKVDGYPAQFSDITSRLDTLVTRIETLEKTSAVKMTDVYANEATITTAGQGYAAYHGFTISPDRGDPIKGVITRVGEDGAIQEVILFNTDTDVTTEAPLAIKLDDGDMAQSDAYCTIQSTKSEYGLRETYSYLQQLLKEADATKISRGMNTNALQLVRNGQLTPIFISTATRYVDGSYTGTPEGLEFAPFRTGNAAMESLKSLSNSEGSIAYAAGKYSEALNVAQQSKKNIFGNAAGGRSNTSLETVYIRNSNNIGLRDIQIEGTLEISGAENIYIESVTVGGPTRIDVGTSAAYFTHCKFNGTVEVSGGTVHFDCCQFTPGATLTIRDTSYVISEGCLGATVSISRGASYVQVSGTCSAPGVDGEAVTASAGAAFVGLFGGTALKSDNSLATISIPEGIPYALGTFLFDILGTKNLSPNSRRSGDGLSAKQIFIGKTLGTDEDYNKGYESAGEYLIDHLKAISSAIYSAAGGIVQGAIDKVEVLPGSSNGTIKVAYYSGNQPHYSDEITIPGLTADSPAFAKLADLVSVTSFNEFKASLSSTYAAQSTVTELRNSIDSLKNTAEKVSNKVETVSESTGVGTYPTAAAVYRAAVAPVNAITNRLPNSTATDKIVTELTLARWLTDNAIGESRFLSAVKETTGTDADAFISMDVVLDYSTIFYYGTAEIDRGNLRSGDRTSYFRYVLRSSRNEIQHANKGAPSTGVGKEGEYYYNVTNRDVYQKKSGAWEKDVSLTTIGVDKLLAQASFNNGSWKWFADMVQDFNESESAALHSGITSQLVNKLGNLPLLQGTVVEEFNKRQQLLHGTEGSIVTYGAADGQSSERTVDTTIGSNITYDSASDTAGSGQLEATSISASRNIPDTHSVVEYVKKLVTALNQKFTKYSTLIGAKQSNIPTTSDGFVAIDSSTLKVLPTSTVVDKLKSTLNNTYLQTTDADKKYVPLTAKSTPSLIGAPTTSSGAVNYYELVSETVASNASETAKVPTLKSIGATRKAIEDAVNTTYQAKLPAATASEHKLFVATTTKGSVGTIDYITDGSLFDDSHTGALATVGATLTKINTILEPINTNVSGLMSNYSIFSGAIAEFKRDLAAATAGTAGKLVQYNAEGDALEASKYSPSDLVSQTDLTTEVGKLQEKIDAITGTGSDGQGSVGKAISDAVQGLFDTGDAVIVPEGYLVEFGTKGVESIGKQLKSSGIKVSDVSSVIVYQKVSSSVATYDIAGTLGSFKTYVPEQTKGESIDVNVVDGSTLSNIVFIPSIEAWKPDDLDTFNYLSLKSLLNGGSLTFVDSFVAIDVSIIARLNLTFINCTVWLVSNQTAPQNSAYSNEQSRFVFYNSTVYYSIARFSSDTAPYPILNTEFHNTIVHLYGDSRINSEEAPVSTKNKNTTSLDAKGSINNWDNTTIYLHAYSQLTEDLGGISSKNTVQFIFTREFYAAGGKDDTYSKLLTTCKWRKEYDSKPVETSDRAAEAAKADTADKADKIKIDENYYEIQVRDITDTDWTS